MSRQVPRSQKAYILVEGERRLINKMSDGTLSRDLKQTDENDFWLVLHWMSRTNSPESLAFKLKSGKKQPTMRTYEQW